MEKFKGNARQINFSIGRGGEILVNDKRLKERFYISRDWSKNLDQNIEEFLDEIPFVDNYYRILDGNNKVIKILLIESRKAFESLRKFKK